MEARLDQLWGPNFTKLANFGPTSANFCVQFDQTCATRILSNVAWYPPADCGEVNDSRETQRVVIACAAIKSSHRGARVATPAAARVGPRSQSFLSPPSLVTRPTQTSAQDDTDRDTMVVNFAMGDAVGLGCVRAGELRGVSRERAGDGSRRKEARRAHGVAWPESAFQSSNRPSIGAACSGRLGGGICCDPGLTRLPMFARIRALSVWKRLICFLRPPLDAYFSDPQRRPHEDRESSWPPARTPGGPVRARQGVLGGRE